ncbi:glutaredoxin domain-containing protein [Clostridium fallax]|uniref:Glutaredoxin-like protein, YruB-family n=1 Tax=Clostridium fallax TaxID=1533 RepID=A0A1M4TMH1_9CLOT|nr:glutaredoxin domain-containing protein [Clostridium fallax]SHE45660.1 Glutaredoxin-like protein, YruB-family [Clostridium fallax]SQB22492.1 glutaredoxin [Clostridium fallax]
MIKLYSTSWCPACIKLKRYFDSKGLKYEEINVADRQEDRDEVYEVSKQRTVPVVDINGKIIIGYDRVEIDKALEE